MKITADHWIEGARRRLIHGGKPMPVRRALVIHFTAGATGRSSIEYWQKPEAKGACAHVVIERDGTVIQCRPFNYTCGHAGVSQWRDPKTGLLYEGLNACSIGIELANAGNDPAALAWARKQPGFASIRARHRNGGPQAEWECYPDYQISALTEVAESLVKHYRLDDITGHDCIAPARKDDPGPAFDMRRFREALGFTGLPVVQR